MTLSDDDIWTPPMIQMGIKKRRISTRTSRAMMADQVETCVV
jgi:hypothetical protein